MELSKISHKVMEEMEELVQGGEIIKQYVTYYVHF
jgi:hypothetical protein